MDTILLSYPHLTHSIIDCSQGLYSDLLVKLKQLRHDVNDSRDCEITDSAKIAELRNEAMAVYSHLLDIHQLIDQMEERTKHLKEISQARRT